jgi:hypothetical protein
VRDPLRTIGLWGDGDELAAVADAERRLGFRLPIEDAPQWFTVGDVYRSIQKRNPEFASKVTWRKLCVGLCLGKGADPRRVTPTTTLIERNSLLKMALAYVGARIRLMRDA